MAQWQAPSTHNERRPDDVGLVQQGQARPYLDVDGVVRWNAVGSAVPAGATRLYVVERLSDGVRILSSDPTNERRVAVFGASTLFFR